MGFTCRVTMGFFGGGRFVFCKTVYLFFFLFFSPRADHYPNEPLP